MEEKRDEKGAPPDGETQLALLNGGEIEDDTHQKEPQETEGCTRNIYIFVAHMAVMNIARMALKVYYGGTIRTIERRFGFRSADTGLFGAVNDVGHIVLVLFFGYFGRTVHKPRVIAITTLFPALAGYLYALPYFVLPETSSASTAPLGGNYSSQHNASMFGPRLAPVCDGVFREEDCHMEDAIAQQSMVAYVIFFTASVLVGVGGPTTMILGLPYIDENAPRTKTPFLVACLSASFSLGPITGLMLASFCTRLPENLFSESNISVSDPNFIGAWWLGFVITSTAVTVLCIPMFFYPKHMTARAAAVSQSKEARERTREGKGWWEQMKGFPAAIIQLLTNLPYVTLLVADLMAIYILMAVYINIPRYLESHFLLPAFKANIVAGLSSAGMGLIGALVGGALMTKLKLKVTGMSKLMVFTSLAGLVGCGVMMSMACPKVDLAGQWDQELGEFSVDTSCNQNCSCLTNKKTYQPVCGSDSITYFSPCHAGCTENSNGSFYDCGCVEGGTAEPGLCLGTCSLLIPFASTLAVVCFIGAMGRPANTVVTMRIVPETERSMGLGLLSFVMNLLGFIPGPIVFGHLIDTCCDLWQKVCGSTGSCLLYDPDKFRWRTYGIAVCFMAVNFVLICFLAFLIGRRASSYEPASRQVEVDKKPTKEVETDTITSV